ncbi:hypothetical protein ACHAWF_017130 [Thalassiosira exigua]
MNLAHRALNLWSNGKSSNYRFPAWVADRDEKILPTFGPTAKIYHASDNLPEVRTMATFREPTNIAMDRKGSCTTLDEFYHTVLFADEATDKFQAIFPDGKFSDNEKRHQAISKYYYPAKQCSENEDGTRTSYRTNLGGAYRFTTKNYRMPQIAAYAKTPMRYWDRGTLHSNEEGVHVLSLVGAGFDARQQPDYQYYFDKATQDIKADRQFEFYRERQLAFMIALQCAFDHQLDRIEFVAIGAGAFSVLLPRGKVLEVLGRAWESREVQAYKSSIEGKFGKEITFSFRTEPPFSHNNGLGYGTPSFYEQSGWTGNGHASDWRDAVNRTLFINAWDPWSLVGNGNEMDQSVDGYYGRQSALALLCWPITNTHIQYKKIEF